MTDTYNLTLRNWLAVKEVRWLNDTIRVALMSDNTVYSPDPDNEHYVSDVFDGGTTAEEFAGTGYSRQTLTGTGATARALDDSVDLIADDTTFPTIDGDTVQAVLVYVQVGGDDTTPGDDPLIGYFDGNDYPEPATGGDFTVEWPEDGLFTFTH